MEKVFAVYIMRKSKYLEDQLTLAASRVREIERLRTEALKEEAMTIIHATRQIREILDKENLAMSVFLAVEDLPGIIDQFLSGKEQIRLTPNLVFREDGKE